jgi:hypothetical protein
LFADLPTCRLAALPTLDAHKFMLDLLQSQPRQHRTNEPKKVPNREEQCRGNDRSQSTAAK